jgi:hypothetical protein
LFAKRVDGVIVRLPLGCNSLGCYPLLADVFPRHSWLGHSGFIDKPHLFVLLELLILGCHLVNTVLKTTAFDLQALHICRMIITLVVNADMLRPGHTPHIQAKINK